MSNWSLVLIGMMVYVVGNVMIERFTKFKRPENNTLERFVYDLPALAMGYIIAHIS